MRRGGGGKDDDEEDTAEVKHQTARSDSGANQRKHLAKRMSSR